MANNPGELVWKRENIDASNLQVKKCLALLNFLYVERIKILFINFKQFIRFAFVKAKANVIF